MNESSSLLLFLKFAVPLAALIWYARKTQADAEAARRSREAREAKTTGSATPEASGGGDGHDNAP